MECSRAILIKLLVDWLAIATGNASAIAKFNAANSTNFGTFMSSAAIFAGYAIALAGPSVFRGTLL